MLGTAHTSSQRPTSAGPWASSHTGPSRTGTLFARAVDGGRLLDRLLHHNVLVCHRGRIVPHEKGAPKGGNLGSPKLKTTRGGDSRGQKRGLTTGHGQWQVHSFVWS